MEVAWWLEHRSIDTVLVALTDGDLAWDDEAGDFRWDKTTPLPSVLKGRFRAEPKWIDLRGHREAPDTNDPIFMEAAADLAAAIHGVPKEDLLSQEIRQQKRALTLASSAAAVLLVLAGLAAWQWAEAVKQQRIAQAQRDRAELALSAATMTANTLVLDLAREFRDREGIPSDLVRRILDRARTLQQQLTEAGTSSPALLQSAGAALDELVVTLLDLGDTAGALSAAERGRDILRTLSAAEPDKPLWRRELSVAYNKIGYVLLRAGRREQAIEAYRQALAIAEQLLASDPENRQWQRDLEITLTHIGDALVLSGRREEALVVFRRVHAATESYSNANPDDTRARRDLAVLLEKIGDVLIETDAADQALDAFRKSHALRERLANSDLGSVAFARDLSVTTDRLGDALLRTGQGLPRLTRFVRASPSASGWPRPIRPMCSTKAISSSASTASATR